MQAAKASAGQYLVKKHLFNSSIVHVELFAQAFPAAKSNISAGARPFSQEVKSNLKKKSQKLMNNRKPRYA